MKNVGAKMRELRIGKRYSKQHVADAIAKVEPRVDVPLISRYENGVCLATPPQVKAICELYGSITARQTISMLWTRLFPNGWTP